MCCPAPVPVAACCSGVDCFQVSLYCLDQELRPDVLSLISTQWLDHPEEWLQSLAVAAVDGSISRMAMELAGQLQGALGAELSPAAAPGLE